MRDRRVVVTGLGAVTSIGIGVSPFREALRRGASGISAISVFDTAGFSSNLGCEVRGFTPQRWVRKLDYRNLGRSSQFCVAAARMAVEDSGIDPEMLSRSDSGVSVGTTD